jgi:hypothetical protein
MKLLTKTDFILYRDCAKNVWIKWHKPEEYAKFEVSEFEKSLGVMGNEVEELARKMFPGGYLIGRRSDGAQELTKKLIAEHTLVIFQAVFATDKYLAAADVLKWNPEANAYDLYEIKMSSTKEIEEDEEIEEGKPEKVNKKRELQYEYDLAFQTNVAKLCGININNKYLLRLDKKYIKAGEFNLTKLFIETDKTDKINEVFQSVTMTEMENAFEYLSKTEKPAEHCDCYYTRGRSAHCTSFSISNLGVPEYSVHDLYRIGNSKKYLKELIDEGIEDIGKVPEDDRLKPKKAKEGEKQSKPRKLNQIRVHKSQKPIVDIEAIKKELNSLTFPLYFLDYETYPTAIPLFDGYHPYQHIVFQYSLHILRSKDARLEHQESLIFSGDPSEHIVESLQKHIGSTGSIISWYKHFENSRNRELAILVPSQADFLNDIIKRTYDLMDIVDNQHYVHHGFRGSSSIKKVQPVLAPQFSYKNLGVQNGTDAIEAYRQISKGELIGEAVEEKKRQMLEYCKNDTEVMYVIWKFFTDLVEKNGTR